MKRISGLVLAGMLGLGVYGHVSSQEIQEKVCLLRGQEIMELHEYFDKLISDRVLRRNVPMSDEERDKHRKTLVENTMGSLSAHFYIVDTEGNCPTRMHDKYQKE